MLPVDLLWQPQFHLPADSNSCLQAMQRLTFIGKSGKLASLRAWFFCSISFSITGGRGFTLSFFSLGGVSMAVAFR